MEDVLKIYEKPLSEREPVVCVDEKPVVLHADVRPPRPMWPGQILRRDCEYERRGTANVFCGVEPKAGRHFIKPTSYRCPAQFADYLVEIVASYPEVETIHLVMDNLSSLNRKALVHRFGEKIGGLLWGRFTVHYTPKHGSWLNQAEIEISLFTRQCLGQRRIPSLSDLRREAKAWNRKMNRNPVTINTRFAYVSVSRASQDVQIFTNNLAQLAPQLSSDISKTSAIKIGQSALLAPEIALTCFFRRRLKNLNRYTKIRPILQTVPGELEYVRLVRRILSTLSKEFGVH